MALESLEGRDHSEVGFREERSSDYAISSRDHLKKAGDPTPSVTCTPSTEVPRESSSTSSQQDALKEPDLPQEEATP
jgi:hypothetical protein